MSPAPTWTVSGCRSPGTFWLPKSRPGLRLVNDYGEGTIIEPTREFGYRDLETLSSGPATQALRFPGRLFGLRKAGVNPAVAGPIASEFFQPRYADAERKLKRAEQK